MRTLILTATLALPLTAFATGGHTDCKDGKKCGEPPKQTHVNIHPNIHNKGSKPPPPVSSPASHSSSSSSSDSDASASASIGSVSAGATGGTGGAASAATGDSAGGTSSLSSQSHDSYRALSLVIPPPAFTPPMSAVACPSAQISQSAVSFGLGIYSQAEGKTDTSDCTLIQIRNAKVELCQYASAKQIEDLLVAKHLPDFKPTDGVKFVDYTAHECAMLKSPPPPPVPPAILIPPPPAAPVAPPAPVKKAVAKKPPCPTGEKLQCKPV